MMRARTAGATDESRICSCHPWAAAFWAACCFVIEHNIELYCLGLGILATLLGGGFSRELIAEALRERCRPG